MKAIINPDEYTAIQKNLDAESKEYYKNLMKEKKLPVAKKAFAFFVSSLVLLSLVPVCIIVLSILYSIKTIPSNVVNPINWTLFGTMLVLLLVGSYLYSLHIGQKSLVKQEAYKQIDYHKVLPDIFKTFNIDFVNDPTETEKSDHDSIYDLEKYVKNLYENEENLQFEETSKSYIFKDMDTNDKWVVREVAVTKEGSDKPEYSLFFKGEITNDLEQSFYAFYQGELGSQLSKKETNQFVKVDEEMELYATANVIKDETKKDLFNFYKEYSLSSKNFGINYMFETKKMYIWVKTSSKLFEASKVPNVSAILLNHAYLVTSMMEKSSNLLK